MAATTSHTPANHVAAKRVVDRLDAGSRNEKSKASDRDKRQKAERTSKDKRADK